MSADAPVTAPAGSARLFLAMGALTTGVGYALILTLRPYLGDQSANFFAYVAMTPIAFGLHRRISFRHAGPAAPAFARYVAGLFCAVVTSQVVLAVGLAIGAPGPVAQAIALGAGVVMQWISARHFVFIDGEAA